MNGLVYKKNPDESSICNGLVYRKDIVLYIRKIKTAYQVT